jgi:chromosome segregation ATPase
MAHPSRPTRHLIGDRVATAKTRTELVEQDIQRAEDEVKLAGQILTGKLARGGADAELAQVAAQARGVEGELREARAELQGVADLLESEERDRRRLEQELARSEVAHGPPAGERSGEGSASIIAHLRELTRHKVNPDPGVAGSVRAASTPVAPGSK